MRLDSSGPARHRLVEQHQLRPRREREADFQRALLAWDRFPAVESAFALKPISSAMVRASSNSAVSFGHRPARTRSWTAARLDGKRQLSSTLKRKSAEV